MGTRYGDFTADLQHIGEIYRKLCSTNASDSSFKKIQTAQNTTLRTVTGAHKMVSIDHLKPRVPHAESQGPLRYAFCAVPCDLFGGGPRQSWHHNSTA